MAFRGRGAKGMAAWMARAKRGIGTACSQCRARKSAGVSALRQRHVGAAAGSTAWVDTMMTTQGTRHGHRSEGEQRSGVVVKARARRARVARGKSRRRDCKTAGTAGARRRDATAWARTAVSARKADTLADWGAVMGVKKRSSNDMRPLGWQRRASDALARRAACAGAELTRRDISSTR